MNALSNCPSRLVLRVAATVLPLVAVAYAAQADDILPLSLNDPIAATLDGRISAPYAERIISHSHAFDLLVASDGQLYYVDHFGGELGTLDVGTGQKTALLTGLRAPYHMTEFQNRLYFTEFGTTGANTATGPSPSSIRRRACTRDCETAFTRPHRSRPTAPATYTSWKSLAPPRASAESIGCSNFQLPAESSKY